MPTSIESTPKTGEEQLVEIIILPDDISRAEVDLAAGAHICDCSPMVQALNRLRPDLVAKVTRYEVEYFDKVTGTPCGNFWLSETAYTVGCLEASVLLWNGDRDRLMYLISNPVRIPVPEVRGEATNV